MTDMGETMSTIERLAREVFKDLGDLATNSFVDDFEQLQTAVKGSQHPLMEESIVALGQIAAVAEALQALVPGGIAAAETIGNHARHWRG